VHFQYLKRGRLVASADVESTTRLSEAIHHADALLPHRAGLRQPRLRFNNTASTTAYIMQFMMTVVACPRAAAMSRGGWEATRAKLGAVAGIATGEIRGCRRRATMTADLIPAAAAVSAGRGGQGPNGAQRHLLNRGASFAVLFHPLEGRFLNGELRASGADSFVRPTNITEHGRISVPNLSQSGREE
jgi:hypothetical protein